MSTDVSVIPWIHCWGIYLVVALERGGSPAPRDADAQALPRLPADVDGDLLLLVVWLGLHGQLQLSHTRPLKRLLLLRLLIKQRSR